MRSRLTAVGCLLMLVLLLAGCNRVELYSELTEQQANEIQAALIGADIASQKRRSSDAKSWIVVIDGQHLAPAMQVLSARGLPRERYSSMGQIFQKEGIVSSPLEERARYVHALQQEMADTLTRIDGVIEARVNIALPESSPLQSAPPRTSASVVIIEAPGANLRERQTDIQAIMTDGVEGLNDPNRVTVKFFTRMLPDIGPDPDGQRAGSYAITSASVVFGVGLFLLIAVVALAWFSRNSGRSRAIANNGGRDDTRA